MANLPVYQEQVNSPVSPLVTETPATGIAEGVGALGQNVQQAATQVGNIIGQAVYSQELSTQQLAYTEFRNQWLEEQKTNPIYDISAAEGGARAEDGSLVMPQDGLGNIEKNREKAWQEAHEGWMKEHEEFFSHAGARTDFDSWSANAFEATRTEVANGAIDETLAFMDQMSLQTTNDLIEAEEFDMARAEVGRALQSGAISLPQAAERNDIINEAQIYSGLRHTVFDAETVTEDGETINGYEYWEDKLYALDKTRNLIDNIEASDAHREKLHTALDAQYADDAFIIEETRKRNDEQALDFFSKQIHTGVTAEGLPINVSTLRRQIAEDPYLSANNRIRLFNMLDGIDDGSGQGSSDYDVMQDTMMWSIISNGRYTNEVAAEKVRQLAGAEGVEAYMINEALQFIRTKRDTYIDSDVSGSVESLRAISEDLLAAEKDLSKRSQMQIDFERVMLQFQRDIASRPDMTEEDMKTMYDNVVALMISGEIASGEFQSSNLSVPGTVADRLRGDDFSNIINARSEGLHDFAGNYAGPAEALSYAKVTGQNMLIDNFSHALSNVSGGELSEDGNHIIYTADHAWHGERQYRFVPTRNGKGTTLEFYNGEEWTASTLKTDKEYQRNMDELAATVGTEEHLNNAHEVFEIAANPILNWTEIPEGTKFYGDFPYDMLFLPAEQARLLADNMDLGIDGQSFGTQLREAKRAETVEYFTEGVGRRTRDRKLDERIRDHLMWLQYPEHMIDPAIRTIRGEIGR